MKQRRSSRRQDSVDTQQDQTQIKSDHKPVISVYTDHQRVADSFQCHQLIQCVLRNGDIRDFPGDLRPLADGDSHIGG